MGMVTAGAQGQTTRTVTNLSNDGVGSFRDILTQAQEGDIIRFSQSGSIQLTEQLVIDKSLSINPAGGQIILDGIDQSTRLVNINAPGTVSITNVTFRNGGAQGGSGGNGGFAGGGGGAGLGGAIFAESGNVVLIDARFENNRAIGGDGGTGDDAAVGNEQVSFQGGSGGGGASSGSNGPGASVPADGLSYVSINPVQGGAGGTADLNVQNPGGSGGIGTPAAAVAGGAGANGSGNNGGGGGGGPSLYGEGGNGGDGGFGGGGGGGGDGETDKESPSEPDAVDVDGLGGDGGFGGGGGAGAQNRADMFPPVERGGIGGIGGGDGEIITDGGTLGAGDGGGGAGLGGAVFVRSGATLTLQGTSLIQQTGNSVTAGAAGGSGAQDGGAVGSFIFVQDGQLNVEVISDLTFDGSAIGDSSQLSPRANLSSPRSSLVKTGVGTLTLTGDDDPSTDDFLFNGTIFVDEGDLRIDRSAFLFVVVDSRTGGTVSGDGSAAVLLNTTGRVNPGSGPGEIGTLVVTQTYEQRAGADLDIDFGPDGVDLLAVQGTATLNGDLNLIETAPGVELDIPLVFLTAANILGSFDNVNTTFVNGSVLTSSAVDFTSTTGTVTFTQVDPTFNLAGTTGAARQIGESIDDLAEGDATEMALAASIINGLTGGAPLVVNGAFNPVIQQGLESQTNVVQNAAAAGAASAGTQANAIARSRVSGAGLGRGDTPDLLLLDIRSYDDLFGNPRATEAPREADPIVYDEVTLGEEDSAFETRPFSLWVEGVAGKGEIDADQNGSGSETETTGITAGAEWLADDGRTVAGVFVGSTETTVEVDGLDDEGNIDSLLVGVYGSTPLGDGFSLNGSLSVGMLEFDSTRPTGSGTASSSSDGMAFNGSIELLKNISLDRRSVLSPFVGLEGSFVERDGFTETGAGVLNLDVEDATDEYLTGLVGLQWVGSYDVGKDLRLKPAARAGLGFQFLDESASTTSSFTSNPGTSFTSTGAERGSNSVRVGVSLELSPRLSNRWAVYGRYTGDFADGGNDHVGQVGIRFAF